MIGTLAEDLIEGQISSILVSPFGFLSSLDHLQMRVIAPRGIQRRGLDEVRARQLIDQTQVLIRK
jgi:hypothetical protein